MHDNASQPIKSFLGHVTFGERQQLANGLTAAWTYLVNLRNHFQPSPSLKRMRRTGPREPREFILCKPASLQRCFHDPSEVLQCPDLLLQLLHIKHCPRSELLKYRPDKVGLIETYAEECPARFEYSSDLFARHDQPRFNPHRSRGGMHTSLIYFSVLSMRCVMSLRLPVGIMESNVPWYICQWLAL